MVPLSCYLTQFKGKSTGIVLIRRAFACVITSVFPVIKVFDGIAKRGKTSMRYFYGFKLHLIVNHQGQNFST
ncbi:transposase [Xenorhabdus bovienii]|uniref:transposase n=1 Tax=Xenorhabdus bovienii TaxID=40576 RepID=UPI003B006284